MLVLSRRKRQSIVIGDGVEIVVLSIQNGRVRIGIRADADVSVRRMELKPTRGNCASPGDALVDSETPQAGKR